MCEFEAKEKGGFAVSTGGCSIANFEDRFFKILWIVLAAVCLRAVIESTRSFFVGKPALSFCASSPNRFILYLDIRAAGLLLLCADHLHHRRIRCQISLLRPGYF